MPFDRIEENDSLFIGDGVPVTDILLFANKYRNGKVKIVDGHLCINYWRNETPQEKSIRLAKKEKKSLHNKANYQKMKREGKSSPPPEKSEAAQRFKNPTSGDH